ncbi:hypothetical protein, partial [Acidiphilium sp.]
RGEEDFFFVKKKQKTFFDLGHGRFRWHGLRRRRVFLLLFLQKKKCCLAPPELSLAFLIGLGLTHFHAATHVPLPPVRGLRNDVKRSGIRLVAGSFDRFATRFAPDRKASDLGREWVHDP